MYARGAELSTTNSGVDPVVGRLLLQKKLLHMLGIPLQVYDGIIVAVVHLFPVCGLYSPIPLGDARLLWSYNVIHRHTHAPTPPPLLGRHSLAKGLSHVQGVYLERQPLQPFLLLFDLSSQ